MIQKLSFFVLPAFFLGALSAAHAQTPSQPDAASQFYKIDVQHYDAGMMADLATRQEAIVLVPPNFVIPSGGFAPVLSGGPAVTTLGAPGLRPALNTPPNAAPAPMPPANNRLPDGVERIYALQSNNSLVIQMTPDAQNNSPNNSPIR